MADVDLSTLGSVIAPAYDTETGQVSGAEITAGTETEIRVYSPADVAAMAATHGGGSGAMSVLGVTTIAGAAATTMTVTGLDLSAYEAFKVIVKLKNATGSAADISMFYNSDTTATNYYRQYAITSSTSTTGQRANDAIITYLSASTGGIIKMDIAEDVDGYPYALAFAAAGGSGIVIRNIYHHWTTAANVTSITLSSSVANSLDIGSIMKVYGIA